MKLSNWNKNVARLMHWKETTQHDIKKTWKVIAANLALAEDETDEEVLGDLWASIRYAGKRYDDFPKARVGQFSTVDESVLLNVDSVSNHISVAFASVFDAVLNAVILPRGQHENYGSAENYGNRMAATVRSNMMDAYSSGRWDGTLDNGVPTIALVPRKGQATTQEVVEE